ncbi:hypothetical protein HNY73_017898 [Argiope bruennichi]|uniref:SOCS box domain-containing protein n=1 Tax=Argiope bruennichi TaxID=94029 RepID=A0A8T0ECJ8_ARGBR|nr:hypothetical protein HNY73_017898 [Argiope bruennichi]
MFSPGLAYQKKELFTAADIVQHSFIVQDSISYLDLGISRSHKLGNFVWTGKYFPSYSYSKDVIITEEKCRKIHGDRRILYDLHLDLPASKEFSLKNSFHPNNFRDWYIPALPIGEICVENCFYVCKLFDFVEYACKRKHNKSKILKWLINLDAKINFSFHTYFPLPEFIISCIADCSLPGLIDSALFTKCLRTLDFGKWMRSNNKPERFFNILYQVHQTGRKQETMSWCCEFIVYGFFDASFRYVREVMKYLDGPKFCDPWQRLWQLAITYEFSYLRRYRPFSVFEFGKRDLMLVQLLWFYNQKGRDAAASLDAVRLVWNSVHDIFLNMDEMTTVFEKIGLTSNEIKEVYNFYFQAIDKLDCTLEPRSLQHYSRITVRRILYENNQWLPEGIKKIGLPPKLQRYLNLDM